MDVFVEVLLIFVVIRKMGVYLSEPSTAKTIHEGSGSGVVYCKAEMQGNFLGTKVGASQWKTQRSTRPTLETAIPSSEYSMVTEVLLGLSRPLGE